MTQTSCSYCRPWFATTQKQVDIRRNNVVHDPNVTVHPCPSCGGTKWATSDEMVGVAIEPNETRRWWEFWK